jgi:hypothetical protein
MTDQSLPTTIGLGFGLGMASAFFASSFLFFLSSGETSHHFDPYFSLGL